VSVAQVLLGLGGNLGDPAAAMEAALSRLAGSGLRLVARSAIYRTPPWGPVRQPDFLNLCARAETQLTPRELLAVTGAIEADLGRERRERWGPRVIDIDILAYDAIALAEPDLQIPHPRLTERAFVLVPLCEIAPEWVIAGRTIRDWAGAVDATGIERLAAPDET
jgi:2-amino-4-hydroxy-6-hydroxymethyldihydropteridine diphosphokinase